MPLCRIWSFVLLLSLSSTLLLSQNYIGINVSTPSVDFDIRTLSIDDGAEVNVGNMDNSHFARLFSGYPDFPNALLYWKSGTPLILANAEEDGSNYTPHMWVNPDGKVGIGTDIPEARLEVKSDISDESVLISRNTSTTGFAPVMHGISSAQFGTGVLGETISPTGGGTGVWGESAGNGGAGVFGYSTSPTGMTKGVHGRSDSNEGRGVYGVANSTNGTTYGVYGLSQSEDGSGVYGEAEKYGVHGYSSAFFGTGVYGNTPNNGIGVWGEAAGEGIGIFGNATNTSGFTKGVWGSVDSDQGWGVYGTATSATGTTYGVFGSSESFNGRGVYGEAAKYGIYGASSGASGIGVFGYATSGGGITSGVEGVSLSDLGTGVAGYADASSGNTRGVYGSTQSSSGKGVSGKAWAGTGITYGVYGESASNGGKGVNGLATATTGITHGVIGEAFSADGRGVLGQTSGDNGKALYGYATGVYGKGLHAVVTSDHSSANAILAVSGGGSSYAGYFAGKVHVAGALSKSSGSFKIDHPQHPENKYLVHSFVESPDMMNIYNGNIVTDGNGNATVELPAYFDALNMDFRYQLTVIGDFAQAIISNKINNNLFSIKTDQPHIEVSWMVTGIRKDPWAQKHRLEVEPEKEPENKGRYLHPELYGKSRKAGIGYAGEFDEQKEKGK